MIKGLYTSATGMLPQVKKQDLLANNIANATTTGFKKNTQFITELDKAETRHQLKRSDWRQNLEGQVNVDYAPGIFDRTDNPLDMAVDGDGFFVLQSPEGETLLTRAGAFEIDTSGFLSTPGGDLLLSEGGPIQVGSGKLMVSQSGQIEVDGNPAGRIIPMTVEDVTRLERIGGAMFIVPEGTELVQPLHQPQILQGYIERGNVDIVREMVDMIVAYRTFESNAKALQTQDESLGHLLNRVAGDN